MPENRRRYWRATVGAVILVSALSFTPLVLNRDSAEPALFGLPHTLWAGMAVAFLLVLLTYLGARFHPDDEPTEERP